MGAISRKLHSRRGASILMALGFFLVCGFVGAVILGSATANAEKVRDRRAQQQTYYSVSCAARLIRDTLEDAQCQGSEYERRYHCAVHSDEVGAPQFDLTAGSADGRLTELLCQAAEAVYKSNLEFNQAKPFRGWFETFTVEGEGLDDVLVEMRIDPDYTLTFFLRPGDAARAEDFTMTLLCELGKAETIESPPIEDGTCTHKVPDWTGTEWEEQEQTYTIDRVTRTTTISWNRGVVTKGVWDGG